MGKLKGGIKIEKIDINSKYFPEKLIKIKNPPQVLYTEGNLELLNSYSIAIIGSRACSIDGIRLAKIFANDLANQGLTIVSGMAVGIDSAAHIGTLEAKGKTIAVLGCGFNNIFPKENLKLFNEIIESGGLIVSEYPPDIVADSKKFLDRNRIVSGLSLGVLVIEAAHRSGTSVTCKFAREQNKEIFCVPHSLNDKHGTGSNILIKKGAHLVTSAKDIISKYEFLDYNENIENEIKDVLIEINPDYLDVYNLLVGPPLTINQICIKLNKSVNEVSNTLFMLELDGVICKTPYGYQVNI